jgi:hypothetical protein
LISQRLTSIGVDASSQVLAILRYACGLILGLALISDENPNFEMPLETENTNMKMIHLLTILMLLAGGIAAGAVLAAADAALSEITFYVH